MKMMCATATFAALALGATVAQATNPTSCEHSKQQDEYHCTDGDGNTYTVHNAASAEAAAIAVANQSQDQTQDQTQDQDQSQTSENTNTNQNVNGGNSVNIEGDPAHTTSMTLGVGINFSIPIASGVQTRNAIDAANWFMQNGQSCVAYQIMSKAPRVRNLGISFNCGDKG